MKSTKQGETVIKNMRRLAVPPRRQVVHDRAQKTRSKDALPGGILMPTKRFLGKSPKTYENSVNRGNFMQIWSQQGTVYYIRIKAHESSSPYLDNSRSI